MTQFTVKTKNEKNILRVPATRSSHIRELRRTEVPGEVEVTTCKTRKTITPAKIRRTYTFENITEEMWNSAIEAYNSNESVGKAMHKSGWYTIQNK